jgi:hypothetical protein
MFAYITCQIVNPVISLTKIVQSINLYCSNVSRMPNLTIESDLFWNDPEMFEWHFSGSLLHTEIKNSPNIYHCDPLLHCHTAILSPDTAIMHGGNILQYGRYHSAWLYYSTWLNYIAILYVKNTICIFANDYSRITIQRLVARGLIGFYMW